MQPSESGSRKPANRGESITALSQRKRYLQRIYFWSGERSFETTVLASVFRIRVPWPPFQKILDMCWRKFFIWVTSGPFPGGSSGMVGTSRCIAATLSKFGGPETLPQATPSPCVPTDNLTPFARKTWPLHIEHASVPCKIRAAEKPVAHISEINSLRLRASSEGLRVRIHRRIVAA